MLHDGPKLLVDCNKMFGRWLVVLGLCVLFSVCHVLCAACRMLLVAWCVVFDVCRVFSYVVC